MGKAATPKKVGMAASSSPYARPGGKGGKGAAKKNTVFKFNTNVGQHILKNPGVADAIVAKAELKPTDVVLEIGPGTGNITTRILDKARKCIAIELDPRMAAEVTKRVQGGPNQKKLEVLLGDAIKTEFPPFDVCISNTPYQISSPLVFKLLALPNPPRTAVLMFQREFAQRLVARPGDAMYCRLSVNAQFHAHITHVLKVGKANFRPPPQVESAVVRLVPKTGSERAKFNFAEMDGLLRVAFTRKNRTLRASFAAKEVVAMLARNYSVYASLGGGEGEGGVEAGEGRSKDDQDMDDEDVGADAVEGQWNGFDSMDVDRNDGGDDDMPAFFKEKGEDNNEDNDDNNDENNNDNDNDNEDEDEDDDMPAFFKEQKDDHNNAPASERRVRGKTEELVRAKVLRVLENLELADARARQCDETTFLQLLEGMNREGIHFS